MLMRRNYLITNEINAKSLLIDTNTHHGEVVVGLCTVAVLLNGGGERFDNLSGIRKSQRCWD